MNLNDKDRLIAKRFIICKKAIQSIKNDKEKMSGINLDLSLLYIDLLDQTLNEIFEEIKQLKKYPLTIKTTNQPTVYSVKIGTRIGFIEINPMEILEEIKKFINNY